eukprot:4022368-Alexandrium_andersonii.AAC.1
MYDNLEEAQVAQTLEALIRAAAPKGYVGKAVLRQRRLKGWRIRAANAHTAAAASITWEEIYAR